MGSALKKTGVNGMLAGQMFDGQKLIGFRQFVATALSAMLI